MNAFQLTIEFGPGIVSILTPLAVAVAVWLSTRRTTRELKSNNGETLRDAVDRIEAEVTKLHERIAKGEE